MGTTEQSPPEGEQRVETKGAGKRSAWARFRPERYGTLIFFLVFYAVVAAIKGGEYLSVNNILNVLGQNSHLAFAAAAVTVTLIAGQFDLSVGSLVGMSAVFTAGLPAMQHLPAGLTVVLVLLIGAAAGLINAFLVTVTRVNAFIATLGTGTAFGGVALLYSKSQVLYDGVPRGLVNAANHKLLGIPLPIIYALVLLVALWTLARQTIVGRFWYAIGANAQAARLAGVNVRRYTVLAFVVTGVIAAAGGILLTARFGSADPTSGPDFLLPAFAAAFLGSSILSDGGFTLVGSVVATFLIAFALNGLDVLGLSAGIKPVFNGAVLVGAVALTEELRRRRGRRTIIGGLF
jgi:ribose transport system permease protein